MPDLIAQGSEPNQRWRRSVPSRQEIVLGRSGAWAVPWDRQISRRHAEISWKHGRLQVRRLPETRNSIFLLGKASDNFFLKPGEQFVIGGTTFLLADERVQINADSPQPVTEQSYSPQFLQGLRYRNADQRIDVLSRLPEIITSATSDSELFVRVVSLLLSGIPRAASVAIVVARGESDGGQPRVNVLQWDRRVLSPEEFQPSQRLIVQAVESGESVVHLWSHTSSAASQFTLREDADWAFCTPLSGEACRGWAIYVAGKFSGDDPTIEATPGADDLHDDLKFTELAAGTLSSLRQLRQLERNHASMRQFLSPVVLEAVAGASWEDVLAPRETDVVVLFCDLRGFSREAEKHADDLWGVLQRVSRALGVTTRHILDQNGVVGDFHGDAVMGFWGWPLDQPDAAKRAALAALGIRAEFEAAAHRQGHPLTNFQIGIGLASGRAVAGKIGTADQVTVTVFGPVVNLAARLEGLTKYMHAPILIDEPTAARVRQSLSASVCRIRKVARARPYGLERVIEVSELLPSAEEMPQLSDAHLQFFDEAVSAMIGGDWQQAYRCLEHVPDDDQVKDFLRTLVDRNGRTPPVGWTGVVDFDQK